MKTGLAFIAMAVAAEAFVSPSSFAGSSLARVSSPSTSSVQMNAALESFDKLEESVKPAPVGGGFWFGSAGFWGEEDYRGFVDTYKADNLLNGVYPIVDRVRATKILTTTSESGLLSELEDAGLTLSEAEKLLPQLEEAGLLSFAANNLDVLLNLFGFIAVEPAKIAIPALVSVVKALKGAGLLKLGSGSDAPAASPVKAAKVKATKAVKEAKKAAPRPQAVVKEVKKAAPKAVVREVKKAAPKVKAAVKEVKKAASNPKATLKEAKKAAPKPKAVLKEAKKAAPKPKAVLKEAKKAAPKPKAVLKEVKKAAPKVGRIRRGALRSVLLHLSSRSRRLPTAQWGTSPTSPRPCNS
ncbi:unnamed protein product [Pylaiella littoralis]